MATNQLFQQSEKVRAQMPYWMLQDWNLCTDFIKKGEVETVSERDYRIPYATGLGGSLGTYDPQFGDMGRGSAMQGGVMIASYFNLRLNFEIDYLSIKATATKDRAIKNPFKEAIKSAIPEFMLYGDKLFHGSGTATLGVGTNHALTGGVSVYTLDTNFGTQRLRRYQPVTVYDTTLANVKSAGALHIAAIDTLARKVYLSGAVVGAANDDKICLSGVSGASPIAQRGLYYWNSYATSGLTAGVNRALEPQIISKYVNVNGTVDQTHVMALYHRILMDRGTVANEMLGLCPPAQQAAIYANIMAIQRVDLGNTRAEAVDRLPKLGGKGKKAFMFGDIPHYVDIHQDATRIDYIVPRLWGRARLDEMKFFETPGTNNRFFQLYGGSGAPANGVWFSLTVNEDFYVTDAGAQGVLYGCSLPTLYQ
jgi:hypothetical protein